ncbi:hypothetical protein AAF712_016008 [Marasmius tenuissimus]|uniref:Uncharacterized protein n=1 Tax=Marasmius tenuissimus TaxID=585030 RepID=A0ABR2Z7Y2_9AGAR
MKSSSVAVATTLLFTFPSNSLGYTWNFKSTPTQCGQLTIAINGQGSPPYSVLILPSDATPFPNGTEVRKIMEEKSSGDSSEITFQLKYPASSRFVAVVSDSTGFGSGGTSTAVQVDSSANSSCYNASTSVVPEWEFHTEPPSQIVQCQPTRLWWHPRDVKGPVSFLGVIPGGISFKIPPGRITDNSTRGLGTGFSWVPNIRAGTVLHIVASDGQGIGNGGSMRPTVGDNLSRDNSCLNDQSPSSTASGPVPSITTPESRPSGATKAPETTGNGPETPSPTPLPVVAIVVSAIGGFLMIGVIALILRCYLRKRRSAAGRQRSSLDIDPFLTQPSEKNVIASKSDGTATQQLSKQPEANIVVRHDIGRASDTKMERPSFGSENTTTTVSQNNVEDPVNVARTSRREMQVFTTDELAVELNQRLHEEGRWDVDEALPGYPESNHGTGPRS